MVVVNEGSIGIARGRTEREFAWEAARHGKFHRAGGAKTGPAEPALWFGVAGGAGVSSR